MDIETRDRVLAQVRARDELPAPAHCRYLRERAGLSQQEVADVCGVDRATVARWELGKRSPRGQALVDYVAFLHELDSLSRQRP